MRRVFVVALALSLAAPMSSAFAAGAGAAGGAASISGSTRSAKAKTTVRLRNVANNQVVGTTTADASGKFSFTGLEPGQYVVEVVNASGVVMGVSAPMALEAGAAISDVAVAGGAAAAATAASTPFLGSLVGIVTVAAAGAAVGGVTVAATRPQASSSQ